MPELDDELDLNTETDDGGDDSSDDSAGESGESKGDKTPKSSDKRVSDLQSKADKETARANKAEKRLQALEAALKDSDSDGGKENPKRADASTDPQILEMAQMFAYQQHPRLEEFGVEMSDITGSTPSEVAKNAAALVARFEKIETIARNKVLAEQGLAPELSNDLPATRKSRDFNSMPAEDFEKIVERALRGERV